MAEHQRQKNISWGFVPGLLALGFFVLPAAAAETGTITGTIDNPKVVTAVTAVDRTSDEKDRKYPGKIDAQSGRFTVEGLPVNAVYDLVIDFDGARLEGINLKVPRSDFEEEQPLTKEDIETISTKARALDKFADEIDVLAVSGNIQHAAVVLSKLRTRPFYASKPDEVVWRLELWHFERPEETWVKVQEELFIVHYRERLQKSDYNKKALTLDPVLGGLQLTAQQKSIDTGRVELPSNKPGIRLRSTGGEKPATGKR